MENLSVKNQGIIKQLNLLKGNINLTNEMLDNTNTRQELKENGVLLDLLKTMKEMEPKIFELI
jgi:GAT domain